MPSNTASFVDCANGTGGEQLPTYAHPPLIESWLGADFVAEPDRFEIDVAALRERLGPEWFGSWQSVQSESPNGDRQLGNVMNDRAIRITTRGFAFGWLGHQGERYPRYEAIRDGFVAVIDAVRSIGTVPNRNLVPQKWSVRYHNRIPRGTVWNFESDWNFFRLWNPILLQSVDESQKGMRSRWEFPLKDRSGTLTVKFRHEPNSELCSSDHLWVNIQVKGPSDQTDTGLFDGLDYGRSVVIRTFNELFTSDAKEFWGITQKSR